jgi:hypothetical protein
MIVKRKNVTKMASDNAAELPLPKVFFDDPSQWQFCAPIVYKSVVFYKSEVFTEESASASQYK